MSYSLPPDWRDRVQSILADQIGALGTFIFGEVLDSTGLAGREPGLREAVHLFEALKKEFPSHMHESEAEQEILRILIGNHGGAK